MDTRRLINGSLRVALAAAGLAVASTALAQQTTSVTIESPQLKHGYQPVGPYGKRGAAVSGSLRVSYADLDIATHSGAQALESRIRETARRVCGEIARMEPESWDGETSCVAGAVRDAMLQARAAVDAAESRLHQELQARNAIASAAVGSQR